MPFYLRIFPVFISLSGRAALRVPRPMVFAPLGSAEKCRFRPGAGADFCKKDGQTLMKFLAVELTDDNLSLLARDSLENVVWKKAGGGERVDIPLPPELCGRVLAMPEETARFIAASMKQVGFFQRSVSLILDTEQVISAAFSHAPAPAAKMPAIAELFAQSSLPGSPGNYYISYAVRGHVHPDGQLRSTLFGAEAAKLRGLYRALRRAGIDVFSIEPSSAAFARNAVSSERSRAGRGAGIYLDFGFSSSLVCACRDGQIVF